MSALARDDSDLRKKGRRNESAVKAAVKAALTKGGWLWRMPAANVYGVGGLSDFIALRDGVFASIETKSGTNKLTALQAKWLRDVEHHGGVAWVVNEKNLDVFVRWAESPPRVLGQIAP